MKIPSFIMAMAFASCLFLPAPSLSFENETNGFMGLMWGADISSFDGMVKVKKTVKGGAICKREDGGLKVGDIELKDALYSFSPDGALESVLVVIKDYKDFLALKVALIDTYGAVEDPLDAVDEKYVWSGEMTSMYLTYSMKTRSGLLYAGATAKKSVEEAY